MRFSFEMDTKKFEEQVRNAPTVMTAPVHRRVQKVVEHIFAETQKEVPVDTGALKSSGWRECIIEDDGILAEISYGEMGMRNPATGTSVSKYALAVHENLEAHHPNGKAKYVEDPINRSKDTFNTEVVLGINEGLNKAF